MTPEEFRVILLKADNVAAALRRFYGELEQYRPDSKCVVTSTPETLDARMEDLLLATAHADRAVKEWGIKNDSWESQVAAVQAHSALAEDFVGQAEQFAAWGLICGLCAKCKGSRGFYDKPCGSTHPECSMCRDKRAIMLRYSDSSDEPKPITTPPPLDLTPGMRRLGGLLAPGSFDRWCETHFQLDDCHTN